MRVLVVGATGHVGGYLVPSLVRAGHSVVAMSRGLQQLYRTDPAWNSVERIPIDRDGADRDGTFVDAVLAAEPDVVIDMVCFEPAAASALVAGLAGRVDRLLMCGTIWVHGPTLAAPTREGDARRPYGEYGTKKAEIERIVLESDLPGVVLHPGHISGPGWPVINPVGNLDPSVWRALARGDEVLVPNDGVATMHHVHAADVAAAFELALASEDALGEAFHVVSERAVSTRGLAAAAGEWFGREPVLRPVSWEEFAARTTPEHAAASREHLQRSHVMSIAKAKAVLGYAPQHSSEAAVREAVQWLIANEELLEPRSRAS
ncbi:MAG TPA: NAD-dependent epimerase/dehydratase family protein [Jatrophihabitans sp.]|jgi:nucleoside-diphosphate-sugar epimerase